MNESKLNKKEIKTAAIFVAINLLVVAICAIILCFVFDDKPSENPLNNETNQVATLPKATLEIQENTQEYNNIKTYTCKIVTEDGQPINLSDCSIQLEDVINTGNKLLSTINNRVCSIGIIGSTLYIQTDTRFIVDEPMKMNIITLKDNLGVEDWLKLTEAVQDTVYVHTDTHINYSTELGTRHYLYVYSDIINTPDTVSDATDIITEVPNIEPEN